MRVNSIPAPPLPHCCTGKPGVECNPLSAASIDHCSRADATRKRRAQAQYNQTVVCSTVHTLLLQHYVANRKSQRLSDDKISMIIYFPWSVMEVAGLRGYYDIREKVEGGPAQAVFCSKSPETGLEVGMLCGGWQACCCCCCCGGRLVALHHCRLSHSFHPGKYQNSLSPLFGHFLLVSRAAATVGLEILWHSTKYHCFTWPALIVAGVVLETDWSVNKEGLGAVCIASAGPAPATPPHRQNIIMQTETRKPN